MLVADLFVDSRNQDYLRREHYLTDSSALKKKESKIMSGQYSAEVMQTRNCKRDRLLLARMPVHPVYNGDEVNQTFAILYYAMYHGECLVGPVGDTMNSSLRKLYQTIWSTRDDAYSCVYNQIPSINLAQMTPQQQLDAIKEHVAPYPLPPSLNYSTCTMKDVFAVGTILEWIVSDWIMLRSVRVLFQSHRKALKDPSPQVTYLRDEVINCLREVYYSYPEYKLVILSEMTIDLRLRY